MYVLYCTVDVIKQRNMVNSGVRGAKGRNLRSRCRALLVNYSNTGRILIYLSYHVQAPSTGNLNYWDSSGLRRRFGLVAGAPSGRCGHARAA